MLWKEETTTLRIQMVTGIESLTAQKQVLVQTPTSSMRPQRVIKIPDRFKDYMYVLT